LDICRREAKKYCFNEKTGHAAERYLREILSRNPAYAGGFGAAAVFAFSN